jgi:hypothetical protein
MCTTELLRTARMLEQISSCLELTTHHPRAVPLYGRRTRLGITNQLARCIVVSHQTTSPEKRRAGQPRMIHLRNVLHYSDQTANSSPRRSEKPSEKTARSARVRAHPSTKEVLTLANTNASRPHTGQRERRASRPVVSRTSLQHLNEIIAV